MSNYDSWLYTPFSKELDKSYLGRSADRLRIRRFVYIAKAIARQDTL